MKKPNKHLTVFLLFFLMIASLFCFSETVSAKGINSVSQVKKLALKRVKGATVLKVEKDYDRGTLVYEVTLMKGKKEYELAYRASDEKLIAYEWEIAPWYVKRGSGKIMSLNKCKNLAQKEVPGGKIISIVKKRSHGIDLYKVKMQKSSKTYELKFHARTGKLLEYGWELDIKSQNSQNYIGEKKAKQIALAEVGGGTVVKIEFDMDDGIPVYEVDILYGDYEYEVVIHARTGKVLEVDMDFVYDD